jgi:hypothetical protein
MELRKIAAGLLILGSLASSAQTTFKSRDFAMVVSGTGQVTAMQEMATGKNYIASGVSAPLLRIGTGSDWEEPGKAIFDKKEKVISLQFPGSGTVAKIGVISKETHISFRLLKLNGKKRVNAICWGPYPTNISQTIGEVIGVVRDGSFAIGMQALNPKTIGGVLKSEGGEDGPRGTAAIKQDYGSSLQAYSLDRSVARVVDVWNNQYPQMPVEAIPGETTVNSAIALFGCPEKETLDRIGEIELAEGLPHPEINGVWIKKSPETGRAYLITDFNESNIDELLDYTVKAGLMSVYHEGPFKSWGHYILDPASFPNGNAGMKKCVEKATAKGLRIGVHTLTTFINTNDPYVTPVPDKRLAVTGSSVLSAGISASDTEIPVMSDKYFKNLKSSTLHAVRIGDEIIRFREVSVNEPFRLIDCQRGAFGTTAASHNKGAQAGMMFDYPYQTLFPNFNLQQEIASNLARFFNETGVSQMDFDGHEGCFSSGEGDYAIQAFADKVFRETDHTLVNGTSRSSHYYWHICHYWNWGEPWYGGFRESQGDYRLDNQPLLERNFMPNMLGWFLLSATTGPEDIEWMMARAAGYKAGFALVARYPSLKNNPQTDRLLDLIRIWQEASRSAVFNSDQLVRLKNPANDFHLEKEGTGYKLFPFTKYAFVHRKQLLQPGQPVFSEWQFLNKDPEQQLGFTLTFAGKEGSVTNPWLEMDGYYKLEIPGQYEAGSSVVCDGKRLSLYNNKGKYIKDIPVNQSIPVLRQGNHKVKFDCSFPDEGDIECRLTVKTMGLPEIIKRS